MVVTMGAIDRVVPRGRNAGRIPQQALDQVTASIQECGWRQPIILGGDGVVNAGQVLRLAAKKLTWKEVPVHRAKNLTPARIGPYRLLGAGVSRKEVR